MGGEGNKLRVGGEGGKLMGKQGHPFFGWSSLKENSSQNKMEKGRHWATGLAASD